MPAQRLDQVSPVVSLGCDGPDRQRTIWNWQLLPILFAAVDQARTFFAQLRFHAFSNLEEVITEGHRVELLVYWQHVL